jgi:hypothetical protein
MMLFKREGARTQRDPAAPGFTTYHAHDCCAAGI